MRVPMTAKQIQVTDVKIGDIVNYHGIRIKIDKVDTFTWDHLMGVKASGLVLNMEECLADRDARWLLSHRSDKDIECGRQSVQGTMLATTYIEQPET